MSGQSDGTESRSATENFSDASVLFDDFAAPNEVGESNTASGLSASNDLQLSGNLNKIIASAPGSTISLDLRNFVLRGHSTLSLLGDATSTFTFNVTKQFLLSQSARIILAGGLQWNQVFFNVLGNGPAVSVSGQASLSGILAAPNRWVSLRNRSTIYGQVTASRLIIRQAARIIMPPTISP
jgi:hypothetical protein